MPAWYRWTAQSGFGRADGRFTGGLAFWSWTTAEYYTIGLDKIPSIHSHLFRPSALLFSFPLCLPSCSRDTPHTLEADLDSALASRPTAGQIGKEIGDVVPRMSVQARPQAFLIQIMGDEADAAAKHE